jgi:predicted MFS family arabinose efflux permease
MRTKTASIRRPGTALTLFAASFAGQAAVVVLTPMLTDVASAFDISTATAGQARGAAGIAGGVTALAIARAVGKYRLVALLRLGLALMIGALVAGAAAPTFTLLLVAQVFLGAGVSMVISGSLAAAAEWPEARDRARVLTITIVGPAAAWIVGIPLVGIASDLSWRAGLAVPAASAAIALALISAHGGGLEPVRPRSRGLIDDRGLVPWAAAELLGAAAWAGTSVYSGAMLVETYGVSVAGAALLLGLSAIAYIPGAFLTKRWIDGNWRLPLIVYTAALALITIVTYGATLGAGFTTATFTVLVFLAGGRTTASAGYSLGASPGRRVGVSSLRAASVQFGYLLGAAVGGLGLALGGYAAAGVLLAVMFVLSSAIHMAVVLAERLPERAATMLAS